MRCFFTGVVSFVLTICCCPQDIIRPVCDRGNDTGVLLQVRTVRWMSGQPRVPASAPAASAAGGTGQGPGQPMERLSARTTGFAPASSPRMPSGSPLGSLGQAGPSRQAHSCAMLTGVPVFDGNLLHIRLTVAGCSLFDNLAWR